jgi:hypothetical protein
MADDPIPLKPKVKAVPEDALDVSSLWLDPALGDGLVDVHYHTVPLGKPRDYFRVNPDPAYRRLSEIYVHKIEGQIDEQTFIIAKPMQGVIDEARRCTLVTAVYRDGSPRLWALKLPKDSERDNTAWISARAAARTSMTKWVKLVWQRSSYMTRDAQPGYAPRSGKNFRHSTSSSAWPSASTASFATRSTASFRTCLVHLHRSRATAMTVFHDWRELPFREIWVADGEYYPGNGKANGGVDGDPITPFCFVAHEMRTGRRVRLRQHQLGPFPPYRLDSDALLFTYMATAEFGVHIAKSWGQPACAIDAYVEFRQYVNDGAVKAADRDKGFCSLAGALRYFCEPELDTARKIDMRDRILQGPPFTAEEEQAILDYCEDDVHALARLLPHIVPTIRSLPHALFRAKFQWAMAQTERRGVPMDLPGLARIRQHWDGLQLDLVTEIDRPFGIYEIADGKPHWRKENFAVYVRRNGMAWPRHESGALDETDQTFREMAGKYPFIEPLRELRYSLSKLRLNDLQVGSDGRNRTLLGAYGTKTARNAPSNSKYVFGPAKWLRFLITPQPGWVLIHRDYCQQEVRIAAVLSGDTALLEACESGDVYLGIASQLGFVSDNTPPAERKAVRSLFKTVVLGIQYGLGAWSLAIRAGISLYEAGEILARLRARFRVFEDWTKRVADRAGLDLEISTPYGWIMQCPPGINPRTVRNFPIQSTGAEILHVGCVLAERRDIPTVAPVHDAIMAEAPLEQAEDVSAALDRAMRDAAAVVLRGYELPTDVQMVRPGQRYFDERGQAMWDTVNKLIAKREAQTA